MSFAYIHIFLLEIITQMYFSCYIFYKLLLQYYFYTKVRRSAEPATCMGRRLSHTTDYQPGDKETDGTQRPWSIIQQSFSTAHSRSHIHSHQDPLHKRDTLIPTNGTHTSYVLPYYCSILLHAFESYHLFIIMALNSNIVYSTKIIKLCSVPLLLASFGLPKQCCHPATII